ncbi:uncharacterized protein LOC112525073 isoform X2 [Cynara cardunculus var. scolymus]|uniref:uncharacterized protein LOC112525073 isoform X2 n=1 Tax=Cynara cardunculus var. scolymus TaxID=59895 RepID=UPI000D62635F|nr:uncharacterized protein LOC112525073 isoform X2 [Cynara cardunculus var. scolymus]
MNRFVNTAYDPAEIKEEEIVKKMVETQSSSVQVKKNENILHKGSKEILTGEDSEGNAGGEKKQHKRKQDGTKGDKVVHEEKQRKRRQNSATNDKKELKLKSTPTATDSDFETPIKKIEVDVALLKAIEIATDLEKKSEKKVAKKYNTIRTRTSPNALYQALQSLNNAQRQAIISMGFGELLNMKADGIPSKLGFYVVDNLDTKKMEIKVSHGAIKITTEAIHEILGVPIGGVDLKSIESATMEADITKRWRQQFDKVKVRPADIMKEIERSKVADFNFRINFITLFVNTMADCNRMGCCNLGFLSHIHDDAILDKIDWCKFIFDCVKTSKVGWKRDSSLSFYAGPLTFLTLLYVDATRCKKVNIVRERPAIKSWNMSLLRRREAAEIDEGGFGLGVLVGPFQDPNSSKFETTNVVGAEGDETLMNKAAEGSSQSQESIREGYILKLHEIITRWIAEKSIVEATLEEAMSKFPHDEKFIKYRDQLDNLFKGRSDDKEENPTGSCNGQLDSNDELFDVKVRVDDVCEEGDQRDPVSPTTGQGIEIVPHNEYVDKFSDVLEDFCGMEEYTLKLKTEAPGHIWKANGQVHNFED